MYKKTTGLLCILFLLIACPYGHATPEQIFEIQVGAYSDLKNAEVMRKHVEKYDYSVFTREIHDQDGSKLIQILVGPFSKVQQADSAMNHLKSQGIDSFIRIVEHPVSDKSTVSSSVPLSKTDSQESIQTQQPPADSDPIVSVVQLIHKSRERLAINDLDGALKFAREAVAIDPAYADAWKQLGRVLMLRGDYTEAASSLQTVLMLKPDDRDAQIWILRSYLAQDQMLEITNLLEKLQTVTTSELDNALITDLLARLFEQSDIKGVTKVAEFWMKRAPQPGARQAAAAIMHLAEGDGAAAEQTLATSDTSDRLVYPLFALAWQRLGIQYMGNNQNEKAVDAFQKSLEFKPNWIPALRELGWAYRRAGESAMAADTWDRGLKKDPRLVNWLSWIIEARIEAKQFKTALGTIDRLLKMEPENNQIRATKLALLILEGKDKEVRLYEQKLRKVPDGNRIIDLGKIFADRYSGRFSDAAIRLENLVQSYPNNRDFKEMLGDLYTRWASGSSAREAIIPLQKLVSLRPEDAGAWRDLGWSLWADGQHEEAINAWNQSLRNNLSNREQLIHQVVARLAEEGDGKKATEFYKQWNPDSPYLPFGISLMKERHYVAAREILLAAWESKENLPVTGRYLGFVEAKLYICHSVPEHLQPIMERGITEMTKQETDIFMEAVSQCSSDTSTLPLINWVETMVGSAPEYSHAVTEFLEKSADSHYSERDLEKAFDLYARVLNRDPDRPHTWIFLWNISKEIGRTGEAIDILQDILSRSSSPAVREGVQGKLSAESGNFEEALDHYQKSLLADPDQPELRFELFTLFIALGKFNEARNETKWFSERITAGDLTARSYLAEMLTSLNDTEAALSIWEELHLSYPENSRYAVETARAMFQLCRAEEAVSLLEQFTAIKHTPRALELLAEIEVARGNAERAFYWTEEAKSLPPTAGLLRIRSELAESLNKPLIAQEAAEALLQSDPGNVPVARIAGKAMLSQGLMEDAKNYYEGLLNRNPEFLPSLIYLRDIANEQGEPDEALECAKQVVSYRPWDMPAQLRTAVSLASNDEFKPSFKLLREQVQREPSQAVPLLIYSNITRCSYPGRTTTKQVIDHIEHLKTEGYQLITPLELDKPMEQPRVIIIIANPEPASLPALDEALKNIGGRAILALPDGTLMNQMPGNLKPGLFSELQESGRWIIASSGPADFKRLTVNDSGTLGNPLTHKLYRNAKKEDAASMADRLDRVFQDTASSLSSSQSRIFLYPGGDYGQLSLDTDPDSINVLNKSVQKHFDFAITADDNGYVVPDFDASRLPGHYIPPQWQTEQLEAHLKQDNPFVNARLELAKVLFWQGQHERAVEWFRSAESLGADPKEVNFFWGNNAYREGDLPTSLEKLRKAYELDPASLRIQTSLERAENSKRPLLKLFYRGWDDSDDERYRMSGGSVEAYVHDRLQLQLFADYNTWERTGLGDEKGTRIGGGFLWHFAEEYRLTAKLWHMSFDDDIDDYWGGSMRVHLPNAPFGGYVELEAAREEIDFVEAVRKEILANRYEIDTYSRIADVWDLYADFYYINRTDDNDTLFLDGRLVYRLHEWPFLGIGYAFRIANSDTTSTDYWAPKGLQQHQLYGATLGEYKGFHYSCSLRGGYAKEDETDWRFVWGGRLILDYLIFSQLTLTGEINYLETPTYDRTAFLLGIKFRF